MERSPLDIQGCKYIWKLQEQKKQAIHSLANEFNLSFPIAQVLFNRGYQTSDAFSSFLFTSYERDVVHTSHLKDADKAVDRIRFAIKKQEKILVVGDYDVDGITSSSLFIVSLLPLGAHINFYLPHRVKDGYGISKKIVEQAHASGYTLIITVDNGISAYEAAHRAQELKLDLIITDHHRPHADLPPAFAIVNPQQQDCLYPFKGLPGVGVAFKLLNYLYELEGKKLPPKAYELLMLGIIADVMPLQEENRFWVQFGLSKINDSKSHAFSVLARNGKLSAPKISARDIGFRITPQINALGRLSDPRDAVKFLISSQQDEVERVGTILLELNEARKRIEKAIFEEIMLSIEQKKIDLSQENIIMAAGKQWPPGVIGLVAGKLMHNFNRPTLMFHEASAGILKGSCRSIEAFNIFNALDENKDLIIQFGGHSCAAGLSLKAEHAPLLKQRLEEKIAKELTPQDLAHKITIDAEVELPEITKQFVLDLHKLEPFGHKNPVPLFLIRNVSLLKPPRLLKDQHVKCTIFSEGIIKPIIFFNRPELFNVLQSVHDNQFHIAAHVSENHWEGKVSLELQGIDISLV